MFKKNLLGLLLIGAIALQLGACGKDNSQNDVQNTPPPPAPIAAPAYTNPYQNSYNGYYYNSYNNLPNFGTQQLPIGSYWYNGMIYACPFGYVQNGNFCVISNTSYSSCPSGTWNGWTCVPNTFSCPVGFHYNWWGVCIALYSTTPEVARYCQRTVYINVKGKRKKHCVYSYGQQ